jgi:hypothetical protein
MALIKSWKFGVLASSIAVDFQEISRAAPFARSGQGLALFSTQPCFYFQIVITPPR